MSFELFIAARYLKSKRKGLFTWITTLIGIAGVTIGVAALVATLSVMNGFQKDIQAKVIGAQAHLTIFGDLNRKSSASLQARLRREGRVAAVAPFDLGQAIILLRGRSSGVVLKGLDPSREFEVNELGRSLRQGSWEPLARPAEKVPGIVLGTELAANLGAWLGDEAILLSPQGAATALGVLPTMKKFKVVGLLKTGYYEYDSSTAYAGLDQASAFFGRKGRTSGLGVRLDDMVQADALAKRLQKELGPGFTVRSFNQMNRTLFAALRLEKFVMSLLLALIILVAAFTIASNLILMTTEKLRDIGLLKAMGATPAQVRRVFLWEGSLIGGGGVGLGILLGLFICFVIRRYSPVQLPADIYYLSQVPVHVELSDMLAVAGGGLSLTLLAAFYPAWRAAKVDPVEAIHYG